MKMIIRADDVGYTDVCNIGTFKAIEEGIVTSADVMLDTPGAEDALIRLRDFPWISIGWHTHFWGAPVLDSADVPTLYDPVRRGFRKNISHLSDVNFDEALAECRAEMERCVKILGRAPEVGTVHGDSPFARAVSQVAEEYGIANNYMSLLGPVPEFWNLPPVDPKWVDRKIVSGSIEYFEVLNTDSISALEKYDPIKFYVEDPTGLLQVPDDYTIMTAWHPGYVDYYVYKLGDYSPMAKQYVDIRTVDVHALCSDELKNWIREHNIELVNFRDALYGTCEYQNHLRAIGSDLAI